MRSGLKTSALLLGGFLFLWLGVRWLLPVFFPFLIGLALALAAEPAVAVLTRRLHLPRPLAAGLGVTGAAVGIGLLVTMVCALAVRELGMLARVLPDVTQMARAGLGSLEQWLLDMAARTPESVRPLLVKNVDSLFSGGGQLPQQGLRYALNLAGNLLSHVPDGALSLGTGVISGFMISVRLPRLRQWFRRRFPREKLEPVLQAMKGMRRGVGQWLLAQCKLMGFTFAVLLAGLWLLRIPYALLWAGLICLLDALPVLGTGTVLLPWSLIFFLQADRARGLGMLGIYAVITVLRSVLEPKLVGRHLGLDPLVTLMVLYGGYRLWGLTGMLLAPLGAVMAAQLIPRRQLRRL